MSVASRVRLPLLISLSKTGGNSDYYKDFRAGIDEGDVRGGQSTADVALPPGSERAVRNLPNRSRGFGGRFELLDLDFVHLEHGFHDPAGFLLVGIAHQSHQRDRDNLP